MSIAARLTSLRQRNMAIETEIQKLHVDRLALVAAVEAELAANPDNGWMALFTDSFLAADFSRYLVIDVTVPNPNDRMPPRTLRTVEIRTIERDLVAFDLESDKRIGYIDNNTFRSTGIEPRWSENTLESLPKRWSARSYGSKILPSEGLMVRRHPLGQRLAALAYRLMTDHPLTRKIREIETQWSDLILEETQIRLSALELPEAAFGADLPDLLKTNEGLARLIATMDIHYQYADSPSRNSARQEAEIREKMKALELDEALAVFIAARPKHWMFAPSYASQRS